MIQRIFSPGSDWLYYKIYAGSTTSEHILINDLRDIVRYCIDEKLITQWFFIRYADPQFHLRVRFKLSKIDNLSSVIACVHDHLKHRVNSGAVCRLQIDTYSREIERYSIPLMEVTESLFHIDSENVLEILQVISSPQYLSIRWMISLMLIDSFLSAFKYSFREKEVFCRELYESYKNEFNLDTLTNRKISAIFREQKDEIIKYLSYAYSTDTSINIVIELLHQKQRNISNIYESNIDLFKGCNLSVLLAQYIHMMMNRLFVSKGREHELVSYSGLSKYYSYYINYNQINEG